MNKNPYRTPEVFEDQAAEICLSTSQTPASGASRTLYGLWIFMFGINMILPLIVGSMLLPKNGMPAIIVGATVLVVGGLFLARHKPSVGRMITFGSIPVACGQVIPIAQIMAGALAIEAVRLFGVPIATKHLKVEAEASSLQFLLGCFLATIITGGLLILLSLVLGVMLRLITPKRIW